MAIGEFLAIPGLRGLWCAGPFDTSGNAYDASPNGRTLTYNGNPTWNYTSQGAPCIDLDGTGDALTRSDEAGLDILGTESYVASAVRGLTFGGWFLCDVTTGIHSLISKAGAATTAYRLLARGDSADQLQMLITDSGGSSFGVTGTGGSGTIISDGVWSFCAGRFTPSTELKIWLNTNTLTNTTTIPASIRNTADALAIGARGDVTNLLDGRAAFVFLSCMALSDSHISNLYEASRGLFGV